MLRVEFWRIELFTVVMVVIKKTESHQSTLFLCINSGVIHLSSEGLVHNLYSHKPS